MARSWVITTPNKWFPVESHTSALFAHWFPSWRARQTAFTRLLSRREFANLLPAGAKVAGHWWSPTFTATYSRSPGRDRHPTPGVRGDAHVQIRSIR